MLNVKWLFCQTYNSFIRSAFEKGCSNDFFDKICQKMVQIKKSGSHADNSFQILKEYIFVEKTI